MPRREPTWLRVQPAGVEEVGGEVDVHVAEEEQHVAALPGAGAHIQPLPPRELPAQLDEGEVPEVGGSERETTVTQGPRLAGRNSLENTQPRPTASRPGHPVTRGRWD